MKTMELTNRRFAIFLASGLALAVVVGVLVWKVSDSGVGLHTQQTEYAGQPVAAAGESSSEKTSSHATSSKSSETISSSAAEDADEQAQAEEAQGANGGMEYDPLAPRNANLAGARGGSAQTSYYRPTNAAPAPQGASGPAQTQQPGNAGPTTGVSTAPGKAPQASTSPGSTTVVPSQPAEPQRPPAEEQPGSEPQNPGLTPNSGDKPALEEKAQQEAAEALKQQLPNDKPRPEDPFSASTRVPQAPAEGAADAPAEANAAPANE